MPVLPRLGCGSHKVMPVLPRLGCGSHKVMPALPRLGCGSHKRVPAETKTGAFQLEHSHLCAGWQTSRHTYFLILASCSP